MSSYNKVVLVGNFTRNPDLRFTTGKKPVCDVGLAVNDRRKGLDGEWVEDTTFVDVTFWGRTAEVANEYLQKGSPVLIEGRLKLETWETDGQKRQKLKVVGERLVMLGRGTENGKPQPAAPESATAAADGADIPF